ncbi:hypothetical protein BDZ89DRAFT_1075193 [Hymenopellis radicata]|nr:hypothetical protein BDZ89DRAFT_1075193 [Hymenopellis radicata]
MALRLAFLPPPRCRRRRRHCSRMCFGACFLNACLYDGTVLMRARLTPSVSPRDEAAATYNTSTSFKLLD